MVEQINSLEHNKFRTTGGGTAVAVTNPDGSNIGSSPSLPTDAATETEQQAQTVLLTTIEANQILLPTEGNNQSAVYGYTAGKLTSITLTIGATSYVKTFSYTGEDLTGETVWSVV